MIRANDKLLLEEKVTYTTQLGGVDFGGTMILLTAALARGDGPVDNFTGNKINPKSLIIRGRWSSQQIFSHCRVIVFQWLDATNPAPSGILQYTGSTQAPNSPFNWINVHKIHVLYDHRIMLFQRTAATYDAQTFTVMLRDCFKPIQFSTSTTTPQMYGLYCLVISDDGAVNYPECEFVSELRYMDA